MAGDLERLRDRRAAVHHAVMRLGLHARFHVVENLFGILGARIVGRGNGDVGEADGDFAHGRALAAVAIAACSEHDDHTSARGRYLANRFQGALERIRCVRVVAEDHTWVRGDAFHSAGNLRSGRESLGNNARRDLEPNRAGRDTQRIRDVKATEQWKRNGMATFFADHGEMGTARIDAHIRGGHVGLRSRKRREGDPA